MTALMSAQVEGQRVVIESNGRIFTAEEGFDQVTVKERLMRVFMEQEKFQKSQRRTQININLRWRLILSKNDPD